MEITISACPKSKDDVRLGTEDIIEILRKKFERVSEVWDERGRRVWAAAEAEALG